MESLNKDGANRKLEAIKQLESDTWLPSGDSFLLHKRPKIDILLAIGVAVSFSLLIWSTYQDKEIVLPISSVCFLVSSAMHFRRKQVTKVRYRLVPKILLKQIISTLPIALVLPISWFATFQIAKSGRSFWQVLGFILLGLWLVSIIQYWWYRLLTPKIRTRQ